MQIESFELVPEESALVRQIRGTKDKGNLLTLNKELSFRFEKRLGEKLLKSFGFGNVDWQNEGREHTGPDAIDFYADYESKKVGVEMKHMAKDTGGASIDPAKFKAIVGLGKSFPEMRFALLLLRVSENERKGSAMLFMTS